MKISEHRLSNGSKIISVNIPGAKTVAVYFGFRVGSRFEKSEEKGMAHFLEHMVFKGSEKRKSAIAISREFDALGASVNAATSKEYTFYHIKTIPEYFDLALDVVGDMVTRPLLKQNEITKEMGTIIQEIHMGKDNPMIDVFAHIEEVLFSSKAPMGWHIVGNKKTVQSITAKKMRNFFNKYYVGENSVCVVVGKIPPNLNQKVSKYLNRLPKGKKSSWKQSEYASKKTLIRFKDTTQASLGMAIPGFTITDPRRHALELAVTIIGGMGMMSGRLFTEIREKRGWAYSIYAYNSNDGDSGHVGIFGGIKKDKVEDTIKLVQKEFLNFSETVTDEEIIRAKGYLKGSSTLRFDNLDDIASYMTVNYLLGNSAKLPRDDIKKYEKVTREDLVSVAEELFTKDKMYLSLIGPYKNKEKFVKILAQK